MKRIAAIFCLGGMLALGASSQASASGDPLSIDHCGKPGCSPIASVSAAAGPTPGSLLCSRAASIASTASPTLGDPICTSPDSQIKLPPIGNPLAPIYAPEWVQVTICK